MNRQHRPMQQVAVIGLGRFGLAVARTLVADGHEVLGIDASEDAVQRSRDVVTHALQAVVYDAARVQELGLHHVDAAVMAIGTDMEANIVGAALLVEAGIPYVVARANSPLHGLILSRVGVHRVVYPEVASGEEIARGLRAPGMTGYIALGPEAGISTVLAPHEWVGQPVGALALSDYRASLVLAIHRTETVLTALSPQERVGEGDVLVLLTYEGGVGMDAHHAPKLVPHRKRR